MSASTNPGSTPRRSSGHEYVLNLLLTNCSATFLDVSLLLLKFSNNILKKPNEPKYRSIRLKNNIVHTRILPVKGGLDCLLAMGFEKEGDVLFLGQEKPLNDLRHIRDVLTRERVRKLLETEPFSSARARVRLNATPKNGGAAAAIAQPQLVDFNKENSFYLKLKSGFDHVIMYEKRSLQEKARMLIPLSELNRKAEQKLRLISSGYNDKNQQPLDLRDCLLLELLDWFKNSFFSWVDSPKCDWCGNETKANGMTQPSQQDLMWGASRVESYLCLSCNKQTTFPRYNDPGKLLETRRGRCGEWANCFTLCCRATGFEARHVLDWTDHVWTEVYWESQQRWIHCDPCENIYDRPLLYEAGWGKKLSYLIAFSKDEVVDVSWRYSGKHEDMKANRNLCRESWLNNTIAKQNKQIKEGMPEQRKKVLEKRMVTELVEFMTPKKAEGQLGSRTTGSLAWRLSRGEMGLGSGSEEITFQPTTNEKEARCLHLKYSSASDKYVRVTNRGSEVIGWQKGVFKYENIVRKVEHDWKMSYLTRTEGALSSCITWKFDFESSGLLVESVLVMANSTTYHDGRVNWTLCGSNDLCLQLTADGRPECIREFAGATWLTLTARLSLGQGSLAWQHTQLFRQKLDATNDYPLEIKIRLS